MSILLSVKVCSGQDSVTHRNSAIPDGFYRIFEYKGDGDRSKIYSRSEEKFYVIDSFPFVSIQRIKEVSMSKHRNQGQFSVDMALDSIGAREFSALTKDFVPNKIAIILDNEVKYTATVYEEIVNGKVSLSDPNDQERLQSLVDNIKGKINK